MGAFLHFKFNPIFAFIFPNFLLCRGELQYIRVIYINSTMSLAKMLVLLVGRIYEDGNEGSGRRGVGAWRYTDILQGSLA
jgi:hypothetical protein